MGINRTETAKAMDNQVRRRARGRVYPDPVSVATEKTWFPAPRAVADMGAGVMTCREIADEFIIDIDWFDVTREESRQIVFALERYPFDAIAVSLLPSRFEEQKWIQ